MRAGFYLPQFGPLAQPQAIIAVAQRAEALGYDSIWVSDRVLYPITPQTGYPGTPDGSLPQVYHRVFDPLATLCFVAAQTSHIALGTSVLAMLYYNPVLLARQLTTLDIVSDGRLQLGLGLGWSKDEFDAVGVPFTKRAARCEEFIRVLKTIWTTDPVEFDGEFYHIPRSIIQPKPLQRPHPPIHLGTSVPRGLRRAARTADGVHVGGSLEACRQMIVHLKDEARMVGRDPVEMDVVVIAADLALLPAPLDKERALFQGSLDQIGEDIAGVRALGVDDIIFDPTFHSPGGRTEEGFLLTMERIRTLV